MVIAVDVQPSPTTTQDNNNNSSSNHLLTNLPQVLCFIMRINKTPDTGHRIRRHRGLCCIINHSLAHPGYRTTAGSDLDPDGTSSTATSLMDSAKLRDTYFCTVHLVSLGSSTNQAFDSECQCFMRIIPKDKYDIQFGIGQLGRSRGLFSRLPENQLFFLIVSVIQRQTFGPFLG